MAARSHEEEALVAKTAALIIGRLDDKLVEITRALQELLVSELSEIGGDGELLALVHDSVQGNLDTFIPAIRHGIPIDQVEPPTAALEHARRLAQRGVDADSLIRTYRLGHQAVLRIVLDEIRVAHLDIQLALDVFEQITSMSFGYVDRISRLVLTTYQTERDRWLANQNRMRVLRVREVLQAGEVDIDEVANAIRYPLRRVHLSLIAWCGESEDEDELAAMERCITELSKSVGAQERPLFIAADRVTGWAWIPLPEDAAPHAVSRLSEFVKARPDAPLIAAGEPLPGVDGFRRSHQQALATRAVVLASESHTPAVTVYSDPGLVLAAQFCADLVQTRTWVGDVLGPLASATDSDERMRETLREFLHSGSSFKATADELHLHVNSVKYRIQRALERRGEPIADNRLDVEVALLLCHWFGTAVLS
ncbi:MAG TPA: helix-turn-helix domain-containing protein [Mycobacterium sp.]|uniref:PucR family transcriptional regulator n=1 Tax=Mycobacterium sp. TaxID=1785 RepID=UPI002C7D2714|nr:helix-turn-helix domain-containing protein [Mycobacterium sp.]HME79507.1 helix-turn-helix domain-containing protein [Mycobacterium sp.]